MRWFYAAMICLLLGVAKSSGQPRVHYPVTHHDFGLIEAAAGAVSCRLPVVNVGTDSLTILDARSSCGCTKPRFSRRPIAPGDTSYIEVAFIPGGYAGHMVKPVYVVTDAEARKHRLEIAVTVLANDSVSASRYPVTAGPLRLDRDRFTREDVQPGANVEMQRRGLNMTPDTIYIERLAWPQYLSVAVRPAVVGPGERFTITAGAESADSLLNHVAVDTITLGLPADTLRLTVDMTRHGH